MRWSVQEHQEEVVDAEDEAWVGELGCARSQQDSEDADPLAISETRRSRAGMCLLGLPVSVCKGQRIFVKMQERCYRCEIEAWGRRAANARFPAM